MAPSPEIRETDPPLDFKFAYPRCALMLEHAIRETVDHEWDDYSRKRALDIAQAMLDGCKVCGFRESTGILRSVTALLVLPVDEALSVLPALRERLEDLLGLLRQHIRAECA
ncbi:MAG TPA: hypothetical protein VG457_02150 [Planctomycetota bacterium]|nr:hypothetical protein [Planctomycetota bacterium]